MRSHPAALLAGWHCRRSQAQQPPPWLSQSGRPSPAPAPAPAPAPYSRPRPHPPHPTPLQVRFVVLDEADQMLNVGFEKDVETILENVPQVGGRPGAACRAACAGAARARPASASGCVQPVPSPCLRKRPCLPCLAARLQERQTMLFSATVPKWVKKLVKQYLNDPVVSLGLGPPPPHPPHTPPHHPPTHPPSTQHTATHPARAPSIALLLEHCCGSVLGCGGWRSGALQGLAATQSGRTACAQGLRPPPRYPCRAPVLPAHRPKLAHRPACPCRTLTWWARARPARWPTRSRRWRCRWGPRGAFPLCMPAPPPLHELAPPCCLLLRSCRLPRGCGC